MQLTRETTKIIKGVAILMMITLHCVTVGYEGLEPDWPWLTAFGKAMKLCVAVFALMVGYGYAFQKQKTVGNGAIRAGKLLVQYWVLLFLVFIPGDAIFNRGGVLLCLPNSYKSYGFREQSSLV